jgi:hypothetical protein
MADGGAHCTVLSMHCTGGEVSSNRDCHSHWDGDDIYWKKFRWQLRMEWAQQSRTGPWIVPQPLTFGEIGKVSNGKWRILKKMYRRFILLRRRVVPRAIGHGDVRVRLRPHGGHNHIHEVVVLNVERAHNSRSQSRLMDRRLQIVSINRYGNRIYNKSRAKSTSRDRRCLVGVALLISS